MRILLFLQVGVMLVIAMACGHRPLDALKGFQ